MRQLVITATRTAIGERRERRERREERRDASSSSSLSSISEGVCARRVGIYFLFFLE